MCGIVGCAGHLSLNKAQGQIDLAIDRIKHRGPNDFGSESFVIGENALILGHARLSIIDISEAGHQPMHSSDKRLTIVFNGEIYNYRELRDQLNDLGHTFVTDSDTEVLLECWGQWGASCLRHLVGMFSFAIYDHDAQTLTCARDAFGIKPFFYSNKCGFTFASEIPALLQLFDNRPAPDLQRAYDYLASGIYDDQATTFYKDIRHLPPGHLLKVDLKTDVKIVIDKWWHPSITESCRVSFEDAAAHLRKMFLDSVRLHLRSDVPLGAALSGGLDSSSIVCAMRHLEPDMPIHTFTYVALGTEINEEVWADIVNKHVGAIPHKVVVTPEELASDLDDMIRSQGEPFASTSIYAQYRVFKYAREHGIIVTLDGQGADELLAGYNGYPSAYLQSLMDNRRYAAIPSFLFFWCQWPNRGLIKAILLLAELFVPKKFKGIALKLVGKDPAPAWLNTDFMRARGVRLVRGEHKRVASAKGRRLMEALRAALTGNGLAALLRHGDRNSMRWSIESRVPFLTPEIAEYLLSLPEEYLLSNDGETKHVFREAMRGIVPDEVLDRKDKIGFETPEREWLGKLKHHIGIWLDAASEIPFIDADECRREITDILSGKKTFSWQAWRLINYCRWWQLQHK